MSFAPPDRQLSTIPYPETRRWTEEDLFHSSTGLPSITGLTKHLRNQGRLDEQCALRLVEMARDIFRSEPNIVEVDVPTTVVGDIHGQFYDLLTILSKGGDPEHTRYVFLGDYVDRGQFGCECIFLLFALKIKYPKNIFLLRGNHESRDTTKRYRFKLECDYKFPGSSFYDVCMETFDCLPICALVDSRYLCLHGGLSPDLRSLTDIQGLNRFREVPHRGRLCDLLWSDPRNDFDQIEQNQPDFSPNTSRKCAHFFSYNACRNFLFKNNLISLIRAHQEQKEGIQIFRQSSKTHFPVLMTVFSAPNYCDSSRNLGAILQLDTNQRCVDVRYKWENHPFILPNFENGFQFCERFLLYYVTKILLSIFNLYSPEELAEEDGREDKTGEELLNKKRLIELMDQAYHQLQNTNKIVLNLQGLAPTEEVYREMLHRPDVEQLMAEAEQGAIEGYEQTLRFNEIYEERPQD